MPTLKRPNNPRERQLTVSQMLDLVLERRSKDAKELDGKPRKAQLQILRRKLDRFVRGNKQEYLIDKSGFEWRIDWLVVRQLFNLDVPRAHDLEESVEAMRDEIRTVEGLARGHGSKIRMLLKEFEIVVKNQQLLDKRLSELAGKLK
jgi:hypothetical protein